MPFAWFSAASYRKTKFTVTQKVVSWMFLCLLDFTNKSVVFLQSFPVIGLLASCYSSKKHLCTHCFCVTHDSKNIENCSFCNMLTFIVLKILMASKYHSLLLLFFCPIAVWHLTLRWCSISPWQKVLSVYKSNIIPSKSTFLSALMFKIECGIWEERLQTVR